MAIEHAMWKVGTKPEQLLHTRLESEEKLQDMLDADATGRNGRRAEVLRFLINVS